MGVDSVYSSDLSFFCIVGTHICKHEIIVVGNKRENKLPFVILSNVWYHRHQYSLDPESSRDSFMEPKP